MKSADYFDFYGDGGMRLKGHRVDLEHVITKYKAGFTMQDLLDWFYSLNEEKIQACIDYYLAHKEEVDAYIQKLDDEMALRIQEQEKDPAYIARKKKFDEYRKKMKLTSDVSSS